MAPSHVWERGEFVMKLELTPEVLSLLKILGALLLALISLSGWLILRIGKAIRWIFDERLKIEQERAEQSKKWREFEEFQLLVEGNHTPEHPGLLGRITNSEMVARAASADLRSWRELLGITDSKMEIKKVELMREALGIHVAVAAEIIEDPSVRDGREETRIRTGGYRTLGPAHVTSGDPHHTPLPRPALRKQTPHRTDYRGAPIDRDEDDDDDRGSKSGKR